MDEREFSNRAMACAEKLWRISYLTLRNPADCDDAVQDALLRAWANRNKLRDEKLFETWLVRILINCACDILRKRKPVQALDENLTADEPENPQLRDVLCALDVKYRLPIVLHHLEGYALEECAAMLRIPVSTVKWRLHAGRKQLRSQLEEEVSW